MQSRIQQGDLVAVATGTLGLTAAGNIDGELQMTVAGIEKVIPALGIDKMLDQGVPQATLDRVAPGVKSQDLNNLFGALDRAIPGLGKVVKQNANVGVAAGINALGKEAVLEGRKARTFPLRFSDGAGMLGPLKVARIPPLFSSLALVGSGRGRLRLLELRQRAAEVGLGAFLAGGDDAAADVAGAGEELEQLVALAPADRARAAPAGPR